MRLQHTEDKRSQRNSGWLTVLAALLLAWEVLGRLLESPTGLFPAPSRVILEIYREGHQLQSHTLATLAELAAGVAIALLLALAIGIAYASTRRRGGILEELAAATPVAPLIATAPLLSIWFGFGTAGKIAAASLLGFLAMLKHVLKAWRAAPDGPLQLARLAAAAPGVVFWKIRVPEAIPELLAGLRDCVASALAGAIAAEFIVADRGLGYLLLMSGTGMDIPLLFASLLIIAALLLTFLAAINLLRRALAPWSQLHSDRADRAAGAKDNSPG